MAHVPIEWSSGDKHISRDGGGPSGRFGYLRPALSFRVPDAVQRRSASKTRVNALVAVHR